jgi:hypothetical protein
MKCPYDDVQCTCIDTAVMDQTNPCEECKHYPDPVAKLMQAYPLEQMMNFLPKTIIKDRKTIFRANEIFDLYISRDGMDNWVIDYFNEKSQKSLFLISNKYIHRCLALTLADLIGNGYIRELKTDNPLWKINKEPDKFEISKQA